MAAWSRKTLKKIIFLHFFGKNDPLHENFQNSVPKEFIATPIDVLYSNFVKFGEQKSVKSCVIYLIKNFAWLFSSRYCVDQAQNLPGPAPDSVSRVLQISPQLVHFQRSYIRKREHRQSALSSNKSNIRLKPSFEPKNKRQIHRARY